MSDEDKQRRGRKASKGRKARGHRTGGRNARSLRNSTRQERQELYLRWRSESFDEETNQFIGEYSTFEEFYNVWSTLDNACEPAHDATGNHSPTSLLRRENQLNWWLYQMGPRKRLRLRGRARPEGHVSVFSLMRLHGTYW